MKITVSEKRTPPRAIKLTENTQLTSGGAIFVHFGKSHLLPSGFCIENSEKTIYIDPVLMDTTKTADLILITHAHSDHFSKYDIARLASADTKIICSPKAAKRLKGYNVTKVIPNEVLEYNGIQIETTPAYSIGFPSHPKRTQNVGYIISIDGIRIFHSGDTDFLPELAMLDSIDVVLVPIDGGSLTMTTVDAAGLVNKLKPRIAIPMHYVVECGKADEFKALVGQHTQVVIFAK